jgi:hypothetical protein
LVSALPAVSWAAPKAVKQAKPPPPKLAGHWETPAGRLLLKLDGANVTGLLDAVREGVPLEAGMVVLKGTFVEDNLAGEARVGLVAAPCGAVEANATVMLLLTKSGKLTGSFGTPHECAVGVRSVLFTRSPDQTPDADTPPVELLIPPPDAELELPPEDLPVAAAPLPAERLVAAAPAPTPVASPSSSSPSVEEAKLAVVAPHAATPPPARPAAAVVPASTAPVPTAADDSAPKTVDAAPSPAPVTSPTPITPPKPSKPKRVLTPINALLVEGLGLARVGQYEAARAKFLKATTLQPNRGEAYNGVGMTYAMRNDYEAAIDWYKMGLENAPGFSDLYFNLACAYSQLGKKPMALRYLRLAAVKGFGQAEHLEDPDLAPLKGEPEWAEIEGLMVAPTDGDAK